MIYQGLNSSPIDELGSWYHQRLVGPQQIHKAQQRDFHDNPTSKKQSHKLPLPALSQTQPDIYLSQTLVGWEGLDTKFAKYLTLAVIPKDQQQLQIWGLKLTCKHMARQAAVVTPQVN